MRLIDADALEKSMMTCTFGETMRYCYPCVEVIKAIKNAPTIEPERKTGKWLLSGSSIFPFECDQCSDTNERKTPWCPHCGAKMEGAEE